MKLKEAIEILTKQDEPLAIGCNPGLILANRLGFEALKQFEFHRRHKISYFMQLLPSETED